MSPYAINFTKDFEQIPITKIEDYGLIKQKVVLVVHTPLNQSFRGFVIQARYANNSDVIVDGQFFPNERILSKTYVCNPGENMKHNVGFIYLSASIFV